MVALPPLPLFGILSNTRWAVLRMASTVPRSCGGGSARSWRASARRTSSLHDGSYSPCTCSRRRAGRRPRPPWGKKTRGCRRPRPLRGGGAPGTGPHHNSLRGQHAVATCAVLHQRHPAGALLGLASAAGRRRSWLHRFCRPRADPRAPTSAQGLLAAAPPLPGRRRATHGRRLRSPAGGGMRDEATGSATPRLSVGKREVSVGR